MAEMEADQRIEGRPEDIDANGETLMIDELMPLYEGEQNKVCPERHGDAPPNEKPLSIQLMHHFFGVNDREAGSEQGYACEPRSLRRKANHVARKRRIEAFAHVEDVSNHEDREERRLSDDQANDANLPCRGQEP